ncbi:MAG: AMP-binding protein [Opitutae bacterium]|nr:AMP-binding protein [Opitutae bacterium]
MASRPSYVHGASARPLLGVTISECLRQTIARFPKRDALVVRHQGIRWTYAELGARVDRLAASLLRLGLNPGDRLGIWSPNCAEWVLTQFAAAKAGIILVTINPAYQLRELEFVLKHVGCRALVLAPVFRGNDYLGMLQSLAPELRSAPPGHLQAARLPDLQLVIRLGREATPGIFNFDDLLPEPEAAERARLAEVETALQADDAINIQFTSGTTGLPKGATLSHHNILNNGRYVVEAMRFTEHDRLCIPVPLYHCFGMVMGTLGCITHGACMVFSGEAFDPRSVLEAVQAERCTALYGVPTMFIRILEDPEIGRFDLKSLRTGIMAGAPCPVEVMKRVVEQLHMSEITIAYGMTETSPVSFQSAWDDTIERRVSTVGRIQPHLEAKVVDASGRVVPRGTKGELLVRGYSVMLGYWNEPERTAEAIDRARWMHTGDLATIDEDGYGNIVGRSKDVVIRGGENIYPREVEEFLFQHPRIQEVACVGVPDQRNGEEVCACVVLRPGATCTEEELRAYCQGQIARYKIPRYFRFVDKFPMTVTGKIQKFILRKQVADELGLQEVRTA